MDEQTKPTAAAAPLGPEPKPTTMSILAYCVRYADRIMVPRNGVPCRLCDLPDEAVVAFLARCVSERRLPHRVLTQEERANT